MTAKKTDSGKGQAFFDRADDVAVTGNYDFAIELYVQGIQREPGNLERGHKKLRDIALQRKSQGGKGPGMREKLKHRIGKDPVENMANASFLLAKNPGDVSHASHVLKAAVALNIEDVISWISEIIIDNQHNTDKPNKKICEDVISATEQIERYDLAIRACHLALAPAPDDPKLDDKLKELSAKYTIQKGQYGGEGDFTKAVADRDKQRELMDEDSTFKSEEFLQKQIKKATEEYEQDPLVPGKINSLVEALLKYEEESYESQAMDILRKAFKDTGAYQFKLKEGDIRIRQFRRQVRQLREQDKTEEANKLEKEQLLFEIQEYRERTENYPTDLVIKYEYGRRLYMNGEYDDAITVLQQAQRNPRYHVVAMNYLGLAFLKKEWWQEAVDTFEKVLESEISERAAKEIRYNLSTCYEHLDRLKEAQEQLSDIAQIDFNFKDVRQRLEKLRNKLSQQDGKENES